MTNKKRKYTKDFKEDAVKLLESSGNSCSQISRDLGINASMLSRWNREMKTENPFPGNGNPKDKE